MKRSLLVPALFLISLLLAACGSFAGSPPTFAPATEPAASAGETSAPTEAPEAAGPEAQAAAPTTPPPTATPEEPFPGEGPWEVTFDTADGVTLAGVVSGEGPGAFVLVPMYPGGPEGWAPFAQQAVEQGFRVLTFDLRGYGASGGEVDLASALVDVQAAVAFLAGHEADPIVLVGAGQSTIPAIQAAAQDAGNGVIDGLALLSPLPEDGVLQLGESDLQALTLPTLWLGARTDMTQQAESMFEQAGGDNKELWIYEGTSLRGTYLLEGADGPDVTRRLLEFAARVSEG